jgi:SAM-dependent methyltransferase
MGAKVTGVDFSEKAIETARQLNEDLGLDAQFICSDVLTLDRLLEGKFDIVFTSYGTVTWLPELSKWGSIVADALQPGGRFIMAEFHPVVWMFDDDFKDIQYSYFNKKPIVEETEGSYADKNSEMKHTFVGWNHALEEVVMALINAGLNMTHLGEYDYSPYNIFPGMVQGNKGYTFESRFEKLPLIYSLVFNKA